MSFQVIKWQTDVNCSDRLEPIVEADEPKYGEWEHKITLEGEKTGHFGFTLHPDGIVFFGVWYDEARFRPGHGGHWSSREGVLFNLTGIRAIPACNVKSGYRMAESATVEALKPFIPEGFEIRASQHGSETWFGVYRQESKGDWPYGPYEIL